MKLPENSSTRLDASGSPVDLDSALLEAARRIDPDALIQIFDRYATALYRYAMRLCSDPMIADQTVGDVFAKLLEHFSAGLGPKSNLRSYLYQMTYHLVVDEMRYSKRRAPLDDLENVGSDDSTFSNVEDRLEFEKIMHVVRNDLTHDQQHIIILRFLEGMSLRETALIMGKEVNHVKVLQNRAIQRLRKSLEKKRKNVSRQIPVGSFGMVGFDFAG